MKNYLVLFALVPQVFFSQSVPSVNVIGESVVHVVPDLVTISLNIQNEGTDFKYIRDKNAGIVAKVIDTLGKQLPKENFQTEGVSSWKYYDYEIKTHKYQVSQRISIKLEDISKYEGLMETLFELGVDQINDVSFDVKDREKYLREARVEAMNNAREKALLYAISLEQNIGKALSISELSSVEDVGGIRIRGVGKATPQQTLAPGELTITAKINVSFELLKE